MKKLLSILSVLTISGTAVPTTIAASLYQKQLQTNTMFKDGQNNDQQTYNLENFTTNGNDEFIKHIIHEGISVWTNQYDFLLTPGTFEDIAHIYNSYNNEIEFGKIFANKAAKEFSGASSQWLKNTLINIGESMWSSWNKIFNSYENSSKIKRIKISFKEIQTISKIETFYLSSEIMNGDTITYLNPYFENLKNDFNSDLSNNKQINLGIIKDENDNDIFNKIKEKYKNLDISQIQIDSKTKYSHFSKGFLLKLKVKENSKIYSIGKIKNDFIFNTEINIKKISDQTSKDEKAKLWLEHLNDWQDRVNRQIKDDVPSFTEAQKRTWKDNVAEQMKNYIRDWSYVQTLIDHDLKLEELNNSIENLKKDIDNLKLEINKINKKINDILTSSNESETCSNVTSAASTVSGFIPVFGSILSSTFKVVSVLCKVQNT